MKESVVFVHSTGSGPQMWHGISDEVLGGRTRLHPCHVGYPPERPVPRGVVTGVREDAARVAHALSGAERVHLVAHSYGGLVALEARDAIGDRLASLLLFEPVLFGALAAARSSADVPKEAIAEAQRFQTSPFLTDERTGGDEAWLEGFIDYWNRPGSWRRMPDALRETMRPLGWKMFQEVRSCFFDVRSFDGWRVDVPLTVARGERSPVASRAMSACLARAHAGMAELVDLERASHMAPLTDPARMSELVAAHLARVRA